MAGRDVALDELQGRFFLSAGYGNPHVLVRETKEGPYDTVNVDAMIEHIHRLGIGYVAIGPLISLHRLEENSNGAMEEICSALRYIASETNCAIEIDHHVRKAPGDSESHAGDMDSARGASSLVGAVRYASTLARMSKASAEKQNIPPETARRLIRLDSAKSNYALPDEMASWYQLESVDLGNGDDGPGDAVGVPRPIELKDIKRVADTATGEQAQALRERLTQVADWLIQQPEGTASMRDACDAMQQTWEISETGTRVYLQKHIARGDIKPHHTMAVSKSGVLEVWRDKPGRGANIYAARPGE